MQWLGLGSYILAVCASCWPEWTHRCIKGALVAQPGDPKVVRALRVWLPVGELVPSPPLRQEVAQSSGTQAETDSEAEVLGGCFCTCGARFFLQGPQGAV